MTATITRISVVGHANSGKTSLIRTLLRDPEFGDVSEHPGTTRHVEGSTLLANGSPVVELFDTPGLEDSIGLHEVLDTGGNTRPGREELQVFVETAGENSRFQQETKVIRQLLRSDIAFYVVDAREPILGKYRNELEIIGMTARPVIPVLNFVNSPASRLPEWQAQLAQLGLHATVEFDTVAFNFEDEKRLYLKVQSLLNSRYEEIQALLDDRTEQWNLTNSAAANLIAELFVNVASFRLEVEADGNAAKRGAERVQTLARDTEALAFTNVLRLYRFRPTDLESTILPVDSGLWKADLFDPGNLKEFGIRASGDVARGGAIGAGIDLLVGGLSLGLATALGVATGFLWSAARKYGNALTAKLKGHHYLCVSESTLKVLWTRQSRLLQELRGRGHAATERLLLEGESSLPAQWEQWLSRLRSNTGWSSLATSPNSEAAGKTEICSQIADELCTDS